MSLDDFDLGPLTWVKSEIDQALASVLEQAAVYRANPQDASPIRFMMTHLHQVNGALDMVGLEGVKYYCQALEAMADAFGKQQVASTDAALAVFEQGVRTLIAYLDDLVNGAPDVPLRLFPMLSALSVAQGKDAPEESTLFFPDTSIRAPSDLPFEEMDEESLKRLLAQVRHRFQVALLHWLKSSGAQHVQEMREAIDTAIQTQRLPMHKTLWWVAGAALDVIAQAGGNVALQPIKVFRRLDQQLRFLQEGNTKPTTGLMRDLLYLVARSAPVTERISQVRSRFELDHLIPPGDLVTSQIQQPGVESAALAALKSAFPQLKEAWASVVESGTTALPGFIDRLRAIEDAKRTISNPALRDLLDAILGAAERIAQDAEFKETPVGLEIAAALTLSEDALEHYAHLGQDFTERMQQQARSLRQEQVTAVAVALDVATLAAVGTEIKNLLRHVAESLDKYFRHSTDKTPLAGLDTSLHQISGAFNMLELPVASALAAACERLTAWFAQPHAAPDTSQFEQIADSLSALEFFVDHALREGVSAEQSIAAFLQPLQAMLEHIDRTPVAPVQAEAKPRRTRKKVDQAADAELLDIYLTEATEVLEALALAQQSLRQQANDAAALAELRRGFHTLKGSGRTVGLTALAEVAWQAEQLLNKRIEGKAAPTLAELDFTQEIQSAFAGWVEELKKNGQASIDADAWKDRAASLETVQTVIAAPTPTLPVPDNTWVIGGTFKVSRPLFEIFLREADQNIAVLETAVQKSARRPQLRPKVDCLRAAHTLAGTSKTTGIAAMAELAEALEIWLEEHAGKTLPWKSALSWQVLDRAALALRQMLRRLAALRKPKVDLGVLQSLRPIPVDAAIPEAPVSGEPAEVAVLHTPEMTATEIQGAETSSDRRLLEIFLEESRELFPLVGEELREWRSRPKDAEPPRALQRALHTLKGGARMAGEAVLGDAIHDLETRVIQMLKILPTEADFDQMFAELDEISRRMEHLETTPEAVASVSVGEALDILEMEAHLPVVPTLRVRANVLDELVNEAGEISISRSRIEREMGMFKQSLHELTESVTRLRGYLRELELEADSRLQSRETLLNEGGEAFDPLEFDRYTRLQELTRMMAESVNDVATTQNGLLANLDETEAALQDQTRMNRDLQQELMHIRMIPFSAITERLHRIVRQTARELGHRAEMTITGAQAEIDRSVLEKIVAPLEHVLRNAIAHGLESVVQRKAAHKPETGMITLAVRQEKSEIVITVADDGAGIPLDLVRQRAIERGLFTADQMVDDQALMAVIFESGFSTSSQVTQVSGRGVGLDVVRNEISMLGGRIDVASQKGQGTTFTIYLPATLTMSQVVLIRAGTHTMALPAVMVEQVQVLKADAINACYASGVVPWGGRSYPLHYLPRLIGDNATMPEAQRSSPVLLLRSGTYHTALHVDEILGNQEVVVKRIGQQLTLVPGIVGATVMGDGKIMLIVNPIQLANRAALAAGTVHVQAVQEVDTSGIRSIMVVDDSLTMRKVLGRLLTREGYHVLTAKDGMEALQMLQDELPDAVVLDIEMPRMDGFELARNIRDDQRTAALPLIVVSSRTAEKHRAVAKEIGIDAYLGKPVQDEALLEAIAALLGAKKNAVPAEAPSPI
jgi:chemosensory pili system protein ChpA (sensor histidine kinase/response regulator)